MIPKTIYCALLLLFPSLVKSFYSIPKSGIGSNVQLGSSAGHCARFRVSVPRRWAAAVALTMSSPDGPRDLPRLPPADYSKKATGIGNLHHDPDTTYINAYRDTPLLHHGQGGSSVEVGHVMADRKITLSFTCNVCNETSSYKINRVSFMKGIVIVRCQSCQQRHLIADNLGKMDFPWFGRNLEEYMAKQGTPVKRVVLTEDGLSHLEAEVPGDDYPAALDPEAVKDAFDVSSILPGDHVADSPLSGLPPLKYGGIPMDELDEDNAEGQDGV